MQAAQRVSDPAHKSSCGRLQMTLAPESVIIDRMRTLLTASWLLATTVLGFTARAEAPAAPSSVDPALAAAIASPARNPAFSARDSARHPAEELTFFGLKPTMTTVEVWPGGGYWTEILGAYLAVQGHYYAALPTPGDKDEDPGVARWRKRVAAQADRLGTIHETELGNGSYSIAPPGSADLVLTFRNLHNWISGGYADAALAACFKALKPGGILGIEDHRGRADQPQDPKANSGYVREDYAIALAKKAGFELAGESQINANPRDTKDWVDGVWTLPPTLSQGDKDRDRYLAIGEADNFVLKFRKPAR
jgi:predicted methyltransferase